MSKTNTKLVDLFTIDEKLMAIIKKHLPPTTNWKFEEDTSIIDSVVFSLLGIPKRQIWPILEIYRGVFSYELRDPKNGDYILISDPKHTYN